MATSYWAYILIKAVAFWIVFLILYGLYRFFPVFPLSLISGTVESVFQHLKQGFYAYIIVNLVETALVYPRIPAREPYFYARVAATVFLPWVIFLLWYIAPAVIGRLKNNTYEIIYANLITFLVGLFAVTLERGFEQIEYTWEIKLVVLALFFVSILHYLVFTYRLPWADVFIEPDWR
ncbi:MAG: hypothetical protein M5U05_13815 [Anaerolineales bacterium]|nr:hypothetical protein [Anaerolineales bacterium]